MKINSKGRREDVARSTGAGRGRQLDHGPNYTYFFDRGDPKHVHLQRSSPLVAAGALRRILSVVDPAASIQARDVLRTPFPDDLSINPRRRRLPPQRRFFRLGPGPPQRFLLDRPRVAHVRHQQQHAQEHARLERSLSLGDLLVLPRVPVAAVEHLACLVCSLAAAAQICVSGSS